MKAIVIFSFILLSAISSFAQKPWENMPDMDSVQFAEQYGTVEQYGFQKVIQDKSSHKQTCLLIGAKAMWLYNFAYYLGTKELNVDWDEPDDFQGVIITASHKIYTSDKAPTIKVKAPYNDKLQITSVTINGPADDLINIFINYWEFTNISLNELKSKKAVVKNFGSDKVQFTWVGDQPTIKIIKNPEAAIDMFKLTAKK